MFRSADLPILLRTNCVLASSTYFCTLKDDMCISVGQDGHAESITGMAYLTE